MFRPAIIHWFLKPDNFGSPIIESKYSSKEYSKEVIKQQQQQHYHSFKEYLKRDIRTFMGTDKLQPGYTVSSVPQEWNFPRDRNSRVIEVADTFIGKVEPHATNKYGGRVTLEEVLDAIFQETNPSAIPADPSVHSSSPQPPQNIDGPGIYTTNHSLMDRVVQEPYLAEQLLKVLWFDPRLIHWFRMNHSLCDARIATRNETSVRPVSIMLVVCIASLIIAQNGAERKTGTDTRTDVRLLASTPFVRKWSWRSDGMQKPSSTCPKWLVMDVSATEQTLIQLFRSTRRTWVGEHPSSVRTLRQRVLGQRMEVVVAIGRPQSTALLLPDSSADWPTQRAKLDPAVPQVQPCRQVHFVREHHCRHWAMSGNASARAGPSLCIYQQAIQVFASSRSIWRVGSD